MKIKRSKDGDFIFYKELNIEEEIAIEGYCCKTLIYTITVTVLFTVGTSLSQQKVGPS